jgi:uncharacterized protein YcbX
MAEAIGRVAALWRYPVKSMRGERMSALEFDERGGIADRQFAIRDAEGKFGSGKNTRRFRRIDGLFGFRASLRGDTPMIEFPNGPMMSGDNPDIHRALSLALGQEVTLAREAAVSHFDQAPVHLVTSASLEWLRTRLPNSQIDPRRFRPNIVIEAPDGPALVEESWIGCTLGFGDRLRLRISHRAERCVMVTNEQENLANDPGVLRELAQFKDACFGVYAEVLDRGEARLGDEGTILASGPG